jgi:hypothetical protein
MLEIYDMYYKMPNYYNADDEDYTEHRTLMRDRLHSLYADDFPIIAKLVAAEQQNLLVYDADASVGQFTERLYKLLDKLMLEEYNDNLHYVIKTKDAGVSDTLPEYMQIKQVKMDLKQVLSGIEVDCVPVAGNDKYTVLGVGVNGAVLLGSY